MQGRRYGLIGPNGQGKTSLLKFLAAGADGGLPIAPQLRCLLVEQEATHPLALSPLELVLSADTRRAELVARLAALEQQQQQQLGADRDDDDDDDYDALLPDVVALEAVYAELDACGADAAESQARKLLAGLGFSVAQAEGPIERLSGGWRMRCSLARALFTKPELLLLDEPTNHLDLNATLWLERHLATGLPTTTVVVVSHDQDFLDAVCTDILRVHQRRLQAFGPYANRPYTRYSEAMARNRAAEEKALRLQEKQLQKLIRQKGLSRKRAEAELLRVAQRHAPPASAHPIQLASKPRDYLVSFEFAPLDARRGTHGLYLEMKDVDFTHAGAAQPLFSSLSLDVNPSTRAVLVGANGVGKSTLLQLIGGQLQPTAGSVEIQPRLRIGCYDQHFALPPNSSAAEYLMGLSGDTEFEVRKVLGRFGLESTAHKLPIASLSGGQKVRVAFGSLFLQRSHILLLDEPTNHLDIDSVDALIDAINNFEGGVVCVTHDAALIERTACELWVCRDGSCVTHEAGFENYRDGILRSIDAAALAEQRRIEARALARRQAIEARRQRTRVAPVGARPVMI
eukprot:COSAG01_NODE_1540_length_9985_cov_7.634855_5_plen_571_part_00